MGSNDAPPERDDHPYLHRAYVESRSVRARWRQLFNLPRTDPRYLAATEDDMVADLLEAVYAEGDRRRADPEWRAIETYLRDPRKAIDEDDDLADDATSGTLHERILAFERSRKVEEDGGPRVTSVKPKPRPKLKPGGTHG